MELIPVHRELRRLERRLSAIQETDTHYESIYESLASIESLLQSHYARRRARDDEEHTP